MEKMIIALMIGAVSWLFINSLKVDPVVTAVGEMKLVIIENSKTNAKLHRQSMEQHRLDRMANAEQHGELSLMMYEQSAEFNGYKAKLERVMKDCGENHTDIENCQRFHDKRIYEIPFDILQHKDK